MATISKQVDALEKVGSPSIVFSNPKKIVKTFRFTFSKELADELYVFSKYHQFESNKDYKKSWTAWCEEPHIRGLVEQEIRRLQDMGFTGNSADKMYKSSRYYFRTKTQEQKPLEQQRKEYSRFSNTLLSDVDNHIRAIIQKHLPNDKSNDAAVQSTICPADGFRDFYNSQNATIVREFNMYMASTTVPANQTSRDVVNEWMERLKKTYKNRFYKISHNTK
jgi:hypothetical protein